MNRDFRNAVIYPLLVAALTANVILLWNFGQRLTRIEAKLETFEARKVALQP